MTFSGSYKKRVLTLMRPLTLLAGIAGAQTVPSLINYQGRLSDSNGAALPTADYQLTFRIYDANTGGNLIWGPQIFDSVVGTNGHGLRIPVVQGYFNVMLGPTDVSNRDLAIAFNGTNRFVEIQVTNNSPISPRQWIVAAPYALNALTLAGADWSAVFGTNDPVNGRIPGTKLADGTITSNQIASSSIALGNLAPRQIAPSVGIGGLALSQPIATASNSTPHTFTTTVGSPVPVPGLSLQIQTSGDRPVPVGLVCDKPTFDNSTNWYQSYPFIPTNVSCIGVIANSAVPPNTAPPATGIYALFTIYRDSTNLVAMTTVMLEGQGTYIRTSRVPPAALTCIDVALSPGSHTYEVRCAAADGVQGTAIIANARLSAFEF